MNEASKTLDQAILEDSSNAISSPASAGGRSLWALQDGQKTGPSGQDHVLVNLSARQAKALGFLTSGTYGQPGSISSTRADLQTSLESRLRARLQTLGSTLYTLTWKDWATPSGVSRSRLRASVRRTSEIGLTGWVALPTPTSRDYRGMYGVDLLARRMLHPRGVPLNEFMQRALGRPGYLNPELACSMMGYPHAWDECAVTAMQSSRSKPRSSSKKP